MTVMSLLAKVPVPELTRYTAVKVRGPAELRPVTNAVALARTGSLPATTKARTSEGATVDAPLTATLMKAALPPWLPFSAAVRITSALVTPAGSVSVTEGPTFARFV
jgi:hypothetical protein